MIFFLKRGDTSPALQYSLLPAPIVLTAATVRFSMRPRGSVAPSINRAVAVIEDALAGVVRYDWQVGDTALAGRYEGEFEVTYADGTIETFPNSGFIDIRIEGDVA